jgi:hypothetical protein
MMAKFAIDMEKAENMNPSTGAMKKQLGWGQIIFLIF